MPRWLTLVVVLSAAPAWPGTATIDVDASREGPRLNPRMYGIFLEEINHGVDGGLYAERVANRAFEDSRPPEGCALKDGRWKSSRGWDSGFSVRPGEVPRWSLVREGGVRGTMHLETAGGLNADTPYCLRLDAEDVAGGRLGAANEGFWGIGVASGENRGSTGALVGRQPFGGFRMSGVGTKAGGPEYLLHFVDPRVVTENTMRRGFVPEAEIQGTGGAPG